MENWEAVIGLEVHVQLLTKSKLFCGCSTAFGALPNTHVCPTCLGLPGALPSLNAEAVRLAVRAALALGCTVRPTSRFARKNYFYPDLPKGYQISQFDEPLAERGQLRFSVEGQENVCTARILRVHMEEDAGKSVHGVVGGSVVDLNRAGTPLVEIVGEPDLRTPAEASAYLRVLRDIVMFAGVNDGNLEEGSFRCDANVSIRPRGVQTLGTRVELKNINSFRFVERAISSEIGRQRDILEVGGRVVQETRGWDEKTATTYSLRNKEEAQDYRYFPEPDLLPVTVDETALSSARAELPELPSQKRVRYTETMGISSVAAAVLTQHPLVARFFERAATAHGDAVKVANFILSEVLRDVKTSGLAADFPMSPEQVAQIIALVDEGVISGKQAKEVYSELRGKSMTAAELVAARGMVQVTDVSEIERTCAKVLSENPKQVAQFRAGKVNLLGYFVGQVMKATGGAASPALVNEALTRLLGV